MQRASSLQHDDVYAASSFIRWDGQNSTGFVLIACVTPHKLQPILLTLHLRLNYILNFFYRNAVFRIRLPTTNSLKSLKKNQKKWPTHSPSVFLLRSLINSSPTFPLSTSPLPPPTLTLSRRPRRSLETNLPLRTWPPPRRRHHLRQRRSRRRPWSARRDPPASRRSCSARRAAGPRR